MSKSVGLQAARSIASLRGMSSRVVGVVVGTKLFSNLGLEILSESIHRSKRTRYSAIFQSSIGHPPVQPVTALGHSS